jgi:hypothetical protein
MTNIQYPMTNPEGALPHLGTGVVGIHFRLVTAWSRS